jgi:putative nucleotidyltransferase with HDIG domain
MGGLATAVMLLRNVRTRTQLVKVAAGAGAAYLLMTLATGMLSGQRVSLLLADCGRNFVWGTAAGFLMTGALPLIERCFSIVTDISLLELADGSHPLLQELVKRAPGTYTHSITVATLAEAAAETIGANPLLTRVGCYFHDVGKMLKPHYFIENQTGENRHDELEPALSTLIIIGHVKDGVALAIQYGLPRPIIDFIEQHHGTTLVEYFYREAMRLQETSGNGTVELEPSFRYAGPKPQTRESGVLMLADAVESSSRALSDPTPGSLSKLVHDLLMKRLLDGQFEQSGLTLTELHRIEETLSKSLIAIFHARIKYPEVGDPRLAS